MSANWQPDDLDTYLLSDPWRIADAEQLDRRPTHEPRWRDADPVKLALWLAVLLAGIGCWVALGWWVL